MFIVVVVVYQSMLKKGIRARVLVSNLSADQLRAIFASKVATLGWKVIDNDNPTVAQSPLLSGRRQQISLTMTRESNGIRCHIAPSRVWVKFGGVPYKAHTLRMRLNAFERAVVNNGGISVSASGSAARPNSAPVAPVEASQPTLTGPPAAFLPPAILVAPFRPPLPTQAGQWVSDPFRRHQLRYHDGKEWTPNVSDAGVVGVDPPEWRQASQVQQMTPFPPPPSDMHDGRTV
ncbi:MAG TPA: DUF2510 domain-containing protein [Ilumatobacteraceae bacterium]|nr:DUF2510 domain-containing protein [Ilumatobacteraceae bacterium]